MHAAYSNCGYSCGVHACCLPHFFLHEALTNSQRFGGQTFLSFTTSTHTMLAPPFYILPWPLGVLCILPSCRPLVRRVDCTHQVLTSRLQTIPTGGPTTRPPKPSAPILIPFTGSIPPAFFGSDICLVRGAAPLCVWRPLGSKRGVRNDPRKNQSPLFRRLPPPLAPLRCPMRRPGAPVPHRHCGRPGAPGFQP